MKQKSILFLSLLFFVSCAWLGRSERQIIIDNYEVGWNDLESNRAITKTISSCEGCSEIVVDNYVFAVGNNDDYIIAKQHPGFDTTVTNYYIIDLKTNKENNKKGINGPLNESNFNSQKKKLNIEGLNFNKTFIARPIK